MILKSLFIAKSPENQAIIDAILAFVAVDKTGYIQHPINGQLGYKPSYALSDLICDLVLEISLTVVNEEGLEIQNPEAKIWYDNQCNLNHIWKNQTKFSENAEEKINKLDEIIIENLPDETKEMLQEILEN